MEQYIDVFRSESAEFILAMTDALLALESNPGDLAPVETLFRAAHSLKGMAGMMGYERTGELTHRMESLMDTVRQGAQLVDPPLIDLMLRATDVLRSLVEDETSDTTEVDIAPVLAAIEAHLGAGASAGGAANEAAVSTGRSDELPGLRLRVKLDPESVLKSVRAYMVLKRLNQMGSVVDTVPSAQEIEDERFGDTFEVVFDTEESADAVRRAILGVPEVVEVDVLQGAPSQRAAAGGAEERLQAERQAHRAPKLSETQTVRVSIDHLDTLVDLVGELVILRSRLTSIGEDIGRADLDETLEQLHGVLADLQHEVMQARMVPVGNIFRRFPRMVRDLARDLGKDIAFEMDGLDIELDRTVLDEMGDPILHLLRNSVDHGVESPEERRVAGKPERGHIRLVASREREQVHISVSDDGKGIDVERVWAAAVRLGLVSEDERSDYPTQEILAFTCVPGFSTAEHTTKISGRGVGMDVVKARIESLGGSLAIHSEFGAGTTFELTLPLTLAIIQALMVGSAEDVFALPLSAVSEVLAPDEVTVRTIDGNPLIVMRDDTLVPLVYLDRVLALPGAVPVEDGHVVLLEVGGELRGLSVPRVLGRQEIVIKPLSEMFGGIAGLGGATVLGDGRIALIIDPRSLFATEGTEEPA